MSNILSRKGLALGAIVAIAASFFGGTAAFAADEVTLVPSGTVTLTKTVEDQQFKLLAGLAPSVPVSNVVSLKYEVTTAFTGISAVTGQGTASTAATISQTASVGTSAVGVVTPVSPSAGAAQYLYLKATAVEAATPKSATVVAFLDSTPNGTKDAGEWQSTPVTITWVDAADLATVITLTAPLAGDTVVNASVEVTGINLQQVQGSFGAVFSNNVGYNVGETNGTTATSAATATTSASTGKIAVSKAVSQTLVKGSLVKVQATWGGAFIGDSVLAAAADRAISTVTLGAPAAAGVVTGTVGVAGATGTPTAGSIVVKTNTGFSVVISVGGASVPVSVSVSASTGAWSTTTGATIAGVAYTDKAKLPGATGIDKLALTSGADGTVSIAVTTVGLVSTNALTFTVASQNITASTVVTEQDSTYSIYDADDVTNTANRAVVAKGTLAVNYVVLDQFGVAPADATYRLAVSATQGSTGTARTTGINQAYYPAITAGKAAVSVVDNGAGIGKGELNATLQKVGTDGNYTAVSPSVSKLVTVNFVTAEAAKVVLDTLYNIPSFGSAHVRSNTNLDTDADTDTTDSLDIPTVLKLSPKDFKAYNANLDKTATATAVDTTYAVNVSGTITLGDTGATVVPGSAFTVSGAGLEFVASNGSTGIGTLSGFAGSSGTFSFAVYSHTVGKQTITIKSGTGSATLDLTFKAAATSGTTLAFGSTVAAQAQTGRALDVSVVVTDKWGNIVEGASVAFSSTGAGYINNESVIKSSSKGVSSAKLIAGSSDLGTAYVTATLSDPATAVTLSKSIELGETSVDAVAGGKRVFANVEFAKGKTVTVTIDGVRKYSKVADTDNALELAFTQKKAGKHTVTVRAGSVVTTEVVVTK